MPVNARFRRLLIAAGLITAVAVVSGCERTGTVRESASSGPATTSTPPAKADGPGSFGSLKGICGPGKPSGPPQRGVTNTTIETGAMTDAGNPFAPGLNKEFVDTSKAFAAWCNKAGGINGRKIKVVVRDAKLFDVAARTIDACQSDFMLVGGGNAVDDIGVKYRKKCNLPQVAAFLTSPKALTAPMSVAPSAVGVGLQYGGAYRLLAQKFPDAIKKFGVGTPDVPSLIAETKRNVGAAEANGFKLVDLQKAPSQVDDWRPYIQKSQKAGVTMLQPTAAALLMQPYVQAMNDVGYKPAAMNLPFYYYVPQLADAAKATDFPPTWIGLTAYPLELAKDNPATQQAIDLIKATLPGEKINVGNLNSLNAWLLWAKSATACGNKLTGKCVIDKAGAEKDWTAGGLFSPVNTDPKVKMPSDCVVMMKVTKDGFEYDKGMTQPNKGIFNCDPKNIVRVK